MYVISFVLPQYSCTVQYSTVQYSTVQYSTVQYSTVQYSTVQYSTVQYSTVQYSTVQCSTEQYSTVQYNTVQYSTVMRYLSTLVVLSAVVCVLEKFSVMITVLAGPYAFFKFFYSLTLWFSNLGGLKL